MGFARHLPNRSSNQDFFLRWLRSTHVGEQQVLVDFLQLHHVRSAKTRADAKPGRIFSVQAIGTKVCVCVIGKKHTHTHMQKKTDPNFEAGLQFNFTMGYWKLLIFDVAVAFPR